MCTSEWFDGGRAVAFLSASALRHNLSEIRRHLRGDILLCGVVKADAYGHGAVAVAKILKKEGVTCLAVATADEAMELRSGGIDGPLLVMGIVPVSFADQAARHGISLTVHDKDYGDALRRVVSEAGLSLRVHIKLDTGMTRLGFSTADLDVADTIRAIRSLFALPPFIPEGLFSHFAVSESDKAFSITQINRYKTILEQVADIGFHFRHIANSGGVIINDAPFNMCRVGIVLYGGQPNPSLPDYDLKPVMSVFGRITQIRTLTQPETVGYGRTAKLSAGQTIAVVEIGYADGIARHLSGRGFFLINGKKTPLIGRVSMDRVVINVSNADAKVGQLALYFGQSDHGILTADEVAALADTISYELFCRISHRVPRIWQD